DICRAAAQRPLRCLMFGVGRAHYVGFVFTGKSLPIVFLVPSIFSARFLFFGSSARDRKSTRLNSSHEWISYAVFCLKKKIMLIRADHAGGPGLDPVDDVLAGQRRAVITGHAAAGVACQPGALVVRGAAPCHAEVARA